MLGGYAAEAVQLVLRRIVDVMLTVVQGDTRSQIESAEQKKDAEKKAALAAQGAQLVKHIVELRGELRGTTKVDAESVRTKLETIEKSLLAESSARGTGDGASGSAE